MTYGLSKDDYRKAQPEKGIGKARPFRGYPPHVPVSKRRGSQMSGRTMQHSDSITNRWESLQLQLAEAHSQNVLLQRQLQECRVELKTVQRQNKLQAARLNKAIGQEADMPRIIDHMTADIRSLQSRLREKTNQYYAAQQKISELQRRNAILQKECDEKQNLDGSVIKKQVSRLDEILGELDREKKKVAALQHQLELANRSQKHQANIANSRIRQLRKNCRELESQLADLTQRLQEKIKLLELHNIYSQRLPKCIPSHLPPAHAMTPEEHKETPRVSKHLTQVTSHRTMEVCEESASNKTQRVAEQLCGRTSPTISSTESASSSYFGKQDAITEIAKKSTELTSHLNEFVFEQTVPQTVQSASGTSPVEIAESLFVLTAKDTADTGVTQLDEIPRALPSQMNPVHLCP
ncbi:lebercilin [Clonorchis sinensis]|uniref:Lebercilin n=1 Tax=Clonorchis sinensis TaxID=79923 RepID=G7YEC7_CLOSI|nr:lebercilin [Clonorchis sinensis]